MRVHVDQPRKQRRVAQRDRALRVDVDVASGAHGHDLVAADGDGAVLDHPLAVEEARRRDQQISLLALVAAAGERGGRDQDSETPDPSTTLPIRHAKSFRDASSACKTGALSDGSATRKPPDVCGS